MSTTVPDTSWSRNSGGGTLNDALLSDTNRKDDVEAASEVPEPMWTKEEKQPKTKRGHTFLYCLCDTRRACIYMNAINLLIQFIGFCVAVSPGTGLTFSATGWVTWIYTMIVSSMSIYGAIKFLPLWVGFTFLWDSYLLIYSITSAATGVSSVDWTQEEGSSEKADTMAFLAVSIVWGFVTLYAEGGFLWDMKRGIMKVETYTVEEDYSICCKR